MLRRGRQWRAALGLGRPRCGRVCLPGIAAAAPSGLVSSVSSGADSHVPVSDDRQRLSTSFFQHTTRAASQPPTQQLLAAFSGAVLERQSRVHHAASCATWPDAALSLPEQQQALRSALASRDAYQIFCVLLQHGQQQHPRLSYLSAPANHNSTLEELLGCGVEGDVAAVATLLCACVAVTLRPVDWPSWVSARFSATGAAVATPVASHAAPAAAATSKTKPINRKEERGSAEHCSGGEDAVVFLSPHHSLAADMLRRMASQLPRVDASAAQLSSLALLRWLAQLCGVCLAPSPAMALRLAEEVGMTSLDAAGVALAAYCAATAVTSKAHPDSSATPTRAATREARWLALWTQLTKPSVTPPRLPPFSLSAALAAGSVCTWAGGMAPATLREARVSWHLHCLLSVKEAQHAARLLRGAFHDTAGAPAAAERSGNCAGETSRKPLAITYATQAELLSSLSTQLLAEDGLGKRLSFSLMNGIQQSALPDSATGMSRAPRLWPFVPASTTQAVMYARMLRFILASAAQAQRESSYVQHLHDLSLLLSSANVHALANSLVPGDQPLTAVMVAAKDEHREAHTQEVVGAVRAVLEVLCEEPTPLSAPAAVAASTNASGAAAAAAEALQDDERLHSHRVKAAPSTRNDVVGLPSTPGASSWQWRESAMDDVDGAVTAAVRLLTSLLELCSSRATSLPLRTAEPKWRRELRERTAVRGHKFELLLQELPHSEIRTVLQTLLRHGYHREGVRLGVSLLKGDQVDLRFYTLPLLGSLYLAVSTAPVAQSSSVAAPDAAGGDADRWKQAVYAMYRRRFEIYGDADLNVTVPSYQAVSVGASTSEASAVTEKTVSPLLGASSPSPLPAGNATTTTSTALVRTPENELVAALVLASTAPCTKTSEAVTVELANCLLNRRAAGAGWGVVVDVGAPLRRGTVFAPWIRKGTVEL